MKPILKLMLLLILFSNGFLFAQESYSFYVEVPNKSNIPIVTHTRNGVRKSYSKTKNNKLNELLNSYKIFSCKKVFNNSKKASLQNIYLVESDNLNLMYDLIEKFKGFYPRVEIAERNYISYTK